jgi:imidazolonepropionase-like amidohydrolase
MDWQVLFGGTLIDGSGRAPTHGAAVVIEGERIRYAGPTSGAAWPQDALARSIEGMTVVPGLIDCHDHLAHPGLDLARRAAMPYSLSIYETARSMAQTLRAGITTVRDAGGLDFGAKLAVDQGIACGPRLSISVNILCPTAGHGDPSMLSGMAFPAAPGIPTGVRNGVDDCRLGVREMVAAGADAIKVAATGGVSSSRPGPLGRQFSQDELNAIVDEAHSWDKPVLCHAYGGPGARAAIKAGVNSIDHGGYLHMDEDLLREMADRGTFLVPTLSVTEEHRTRGNPSQRERAAAVMSHYRRTLERAFSLGVHVAMGTDAGAYGHGYNAREVRLLIEAGLDPMQALVASTSTAAACLGMDGDVGTLEPSKYADLIVVDGDPIREVGILEDPNRLRLVLRGGVQFLDRLDSELHPRIERVP